MFENDTILGITIYCQSICRGSASKNEILFWGLEVKNFSMGKKDFLVKWGPVIELPRTLFPFNSAKRSWKARVYTITYLATMDVDCQSEWKWKIFLKSQFRIVHAVVVLLCIVSQINHPPHTSLEGGKIENKFTGAGIGAKFSTIMYRITKKI